MNTKSKIAILGYGVEGKSTAHFLKNRGFSEITVLDEKNTTDDFFCITGEIIWKKLEDFDVIFRSPGISPLKKELIEAEKKSVQVSSHIELFMELCPVKIIAVTGTKGKGTTSSLIASMIENSGKKCFLGGNIGVPPLDFIDQIQAEDVVVLELSSFQTFSLKTSPHIAVVLMVTQEHLDYHQNIQEYWDAKAQLVRFQSKEDVCIAHADFEGSRYIASKSQGEKKFFSPNEVHNETFFYQGEQLLQSSEIQIPGKHNWNNILAALHTAEILKLQKEAVQKTLKEFSGLPFHIETVKTVKNIQFVNDSFSTTPETSIAALSSFEGKKIAVMLGGSDKGSDYSELGKYIVEHKNIVAICYGKMGKTIASFCPEERIILSDSFENAFQTALSEIQKTGGVLLLSAACASFDQFKNYKERGKKFNELCSQIN